MAVFAPRNRVQVYCSDRCGTIAKRRRYNHRVRQLAGLYRMANGVVVAGVWLGSAVKR